MHRHCNELKRVLGPHLELGLMGKATSPCSAEKNGDSLPRPLQPTPEFSQTGGKKASRRSVMATLCWLIGSQFEYGYRVAASN